MGRQQISMWQQNVYCQNERSLLALYNRYEDPFNPTFMLQEYIPGGDDSIWMFNGYFNNKSECLFSITGRKSPNTSLQGDDLSGVCLRNDVVAETTKDFMR